MENYFLKITNIIKEGKDYIPSSPPLISSTISGIASSIHIPDGLERRRLVLNDTSFAAFGMNDSFGSRRDSVPQLSYISRKSVSLILALRVGPSKSWNYCCNFGLVTLSK